MTEETEGLQKNARRKGASYLWRRAFMTVALAAVSLWPAFPASPIASLLPDGLRAETEQAKAPQTRRFRIVATTAMIGEPLAAIAGSDIEVVTLLGEGVDPHLYRPTRSDIARLALADMIVWTGEELEAQLRRPILRLKQNGTPVITLLDALAGDRLHYRYDGHRDPHLWMDPTLWRDALAVAVKALAGLEPGQAEAFSRRAANVFARIGEADEEAARLMAAIPPKARVLMTAHDAFGYFGQRYGVEVYGIQGLSTESEAGLHIVEELVSLAVARKVAAVFVESSVHPRHVEALVEGARAQGHDLRIGGTLYGDAMGAVGSDAGSYAGMVRHNARTIAGALNPEGDHAVKTVKAMKTSAF